MTACVVARHFPLAIGMVRRAALTPGSWVLVMGAAGGLGAALVQVATQAGVIVLAAAGDDRRVRAARDLGAAYGVNYRTEELLVRVNELTQGHGIDVVFENIGDPGLFPKALLSLCTGGRMFTVGAHGGGVVPLDVSQLYMRNMSIHGGLIPESAADIVSALDGAAAGQFRALIDRVLPLGQAGRAQAQAERRTGVGKILLDPTR